MKQNLNILVLSDIHLGHAKNKTEYIINNLRIFFKMYHKDIIKLDMIIISGDIFDKLLSASSLELIMIYKWLSELILLCKNYNISLRILKGTPSHDWDQVKIIDEIIETLQITDIDFKYFDNLDIEHHERFDIDILYVPDEWKPTPEEIYKDVKNKLQEHELKQVDIAVMHGAFSYQLPDFLDNTLNPEDYLKIIKGFIVIGHVHIPSNYKRILVPGSFDRLVHGEEHDKGGLLINYNKNTQEFTWKFLINKKAMIFKTFDLTKIKINEVIKELKKIKDDKPVHIRFITDNPSSISDMILDLKQEYPTFIFTTLSTKNKKKSEVINKEIKIDNKIVLNKEAIVNFITEKHDDPETLPDILRCFNQLVEDTTS